MNLLSYENKIWEHISYIIVSFFVVFIFFNQYYIFGSLPFVQGDNSLKFWATARFSNLLNEGFILWDPYIKLGSSVFSNDIYRSSFSGNAIFLFFFKNKILGQIIYYQIFLLINVYFIILLSKEIRLNLLYSIIVSTIYIYSTSIKSEYLLNGFISYAFLPAILLFTLRYYKNKNKKNIILAGILLSLSHFFGNVSVAQFSFFFIFIFSLVYVYFDKKFTIFDILKFNLFLFIIWLSLLAFYILPFLSEHYENVRSHKTGASGFNITSLLSSLFFPFTSMIFLEEKMIWTGILTRYENMNFYTNLLFLPSLIYFFKTFNKIPNIFKTFYLIIIIFYFLGCLENFFPILSYLTNLIKGTGWWRSLPIIILIQSFCIGFFIQEFFNLKKINLFFRIYFYFYIIIFLIFILVIIVFFYYQNVSIFILGKFSKLDVVIIKDYLSNYYFTYKVLLPYIIFLMSYIFMTCLLIAKKNKLILFKIIFIIFLTINSVSINYLYYPFNKGVSQLYNKLNENNLIKKINNDRIAIIYNKQSDIDQKINLDNKFELQVKQTDYPEFQRLQSNVNFRGMVLNYFNIKTYTNGSTSNQLNIINFHDYLTKPNKFINNYFKNRSYGFFVDDQIIDKEIFRFLNIKYIFSSIEIKSNKYDYLGKVDNYFVYQKKKFINKFISIPNEYKFYDNNLYNNINYNTDLVNVAYLSNKNINYNLKYNNIHNLDFEILNYNFGLPNIIKVNNSIKENLLVVFDIAYHKDLSFVINNKKENVIKINENKIGLFIPLGISNIEIFFKPSFYLLGIYISIFSIIILFSLLIINYKFSKVK